MTGPTTPNERPAGDGGLTDNLRTLAASITAFLRARMQLAGLESKEAAAHFLKITVLLLVALFGLFLGYIFLCIAFVFLAARLLRIEWLWILLAMGVAHLAVAGVAALIARAKFARPVFGATIAEIKKDQEWLNTPKTN
jgi:uncharacterized membrane protein YqjE